MEDDNYNQSYDDAPRDGYDRDRSRSPRRDDRGNGDARARSASPNGRDREMKDSRGPTIQLPEEDEEAARNTGSNLFVTGIHPRLTEEDVTNLFAKFGNVEKCNIMRDPHTRESRGFGFVNMSNGDDADKAKEGLQGEVYDGRTLSIEKARRSRPRTPTPGKYFGPPKREDFRGPPRGGRYGDRLDDRRGGGYGYGRRDEPYSYRGSRHGGGDRYDDRYYHSERDTYRPNFDDYRSGGYSRRDRDDYPRSIDRYSSSRDDRYGGRGDSRRGGGDRSYSSYDDRGGSGRGGDRYDTSGMGEPAGGKDYGSRSYDDRGASDDRYSRR